MLEKRIQQQFKILVRQKFEEAREKNPKISLRAFAGRLGLSAGALSDLFNGKRSVTQKSIEKISDRLELSPKDLDSIFKVGIGLESSKLLSQEDFELISDGIHFSILSLMKLKNFRSDPLWISQKLRKTKTDVLSAIGRLKNLGFLEVTEDEALCENDQNLHSTDEVPSVAVRKSHRQSLEEAAQSLSRDDVGLRDFTSLTIPLDIENLEKYKKIIRTFRENMALASEADEPNEVYKLSIQLFPISDKNIL